MNLLLLVERIQIFAKRKQIGSPKKNLKTIHMPSIKCRLKGNLYSSCKPESNARYIYFTCAVVWSYEVCDVRFLNLLQQLLFRGISRKVHFKERFGS